jgi:hypothetical protein
MSCPSGFRFQPSVRAALGLILLAAGLPAFRGEAQDRASNTATKRPAAQSVPDHRLTEAMVRKVSTVMRDWNPTPDLEAMLGLTDVAMGMSKEKFEALPESTQVRIMVEKTASAKAKYKEGEQQVHSMVPGSLADGVAAAERIPALKAALRKAGFSTREYVQAYRAYHHAMGYVLSEEFGPGRPLPAGPRQDNVNLFRTMSKAEELWTPLGLTGK